MLYFVNLSSSRSQQLKVSLLSGLHEGQQGNMAPRKEIRQKYKVDDGKQDRGRT